MGASNWIVETQRLHLRRLTQADFEALCEILQDADVMYAYEGAFSDAEVQAWLDNQLRRYREEGVGLWAVILKETGKLIGQCGLTMQDIPGRRVLEVGYLFQKAYWHRGYATEAARACKQYAFETLGAEEVYSIIRDSNVASQNVARRNGMTQGGTFVKHYRGVEMPHYIYSVRREMDGWMETLTVYALLSCIGIPGLEERYNKKLDELFLLEPDNRTLLHLECETNMREAAFYLLRHVAWPLLGDRFGKLLMEQLKEYYVQCLDIRDFTKGLYDIWNAIPWAGMQDEPFFSMCYLDDALTWSYEEEVRKACEKMLNYYDEG